MASKRNSQNKKVEGVSSQTAAEAEVKRLRDENERMLVAHEVLVRHWKKHNGHNCPEDQEVRIALENLASIRTAQAGEVRKKP